MHWAVTTLLGTDMNRNVIAHGALPLKRFERAVTNDLLLSFEPTLTRDDALWESFKDHFRNNLDVTPETEEKGLFVLLFHGVRQPGESVYGFATEYKFAALNYNRVSFSALMGDQVVHWMIKAYFMRVGFWVFLGMKAASLFPNCESRILSTAIAVESILDSTGCNGKIWRCNGRI
jgi:hypothetical protein